MKKKKQNDNINQANWVLFSILIIVVSLCVIATVMLH